MQIKEPEMKRDEGLKQPLPLAGGISEPKKTGQTELGKLWKAINAFMRNKGYTWDLQKGGFVLTMEGGTGDRGFAPNAKVSSTDHVDLTGVLDMIQVESPVEFKADFGTMSHLAVDIIGHSSDFKQFYDNMLPQKPESRVDSLWVSWDKRDTMTNAQTSLAWQRKHNHSAGGHDLILKKK